MEREIIKTKKITGKEMRKRFAEMEEEKIRRLAILDTPDLTQEEKELLVEIKMAIEDKEEYSIEETMKILFGEDGLCT